MLAFLVQRLVSLLLTLLLISAITFLLIRQVPGDPIDVLYGVEGADASTRAATEQRLGLDQPLWVQYGRWLGRLAVADFGYSFRSRVSVRELIGDRLPATALLVGAAMVLAVAIGIPLGVVAAVRRDSAADFGVMAGALVALSIPPFASGVALVLVFALGLGWFPTMGYPRAGAGPLGLLQHLTLPAITLAAAILGVIVRLTRSTVLEVLAMDYVRTAWAKGLSQRTVVFGHALRNALLPVVTLIGLQTAYLIGGTVVVEAVFAWPGIGGLVVEAILGRDYPVVQAVVLVIALMVVLISLLVDLTYSVLDPRVRAT
jgi:peptide/nickel transport system permease protein